MSAFLALLSKDIRIFLNDRPAILLSFIVPMVLILIFGMIFSGGTSASGIRLLIIDESQSTVSEALIEDLRSESTFNVATHRTLEDETRKPIDREFARNLLLTDASTYRFALVFPKNLLTGDAALNLELIFNPESEVENQIVQGLLQKVLFTNAFPLLMNPQVLGTDPEQLDLFNNQLADIITENFGGDRDTIFSNIESGSFFQTDTAQGGDSPEGSNNGNSLSNLFSIEKEQILGKGKNPTAQSVGGWAVMFLLFSLTGAASSLFEERDSGLFQRILAAPATRSQILWSKFAFCSLLGMSQMAILLFYGDIVFNVIDSLGQILPLLIISLATAAAATSFGMVLAAFAKTPAQANGLATLLILCMSALGGAMFPAFLFPEFIRTYISPLSPVFWSMDGILAVLWRDAAYTGILLPSGILFGIAALALPIALWRFNKGDLFR